MTATPHDRLFKHTFSQVEHAAGMLRTVLPAELVKHIDFSTLALCPGSRVDAALAERHTDLLFSALVAGREALFYVYFLAEHLSTVEPLIGLRLLGYEVRIWEDWLREHPGATRLPPIVPLVVHHSPTGWTAEVAFEALLNIDPEVALMIAPYIPRFRFLLEDLSATSDKALRRRAMTELGRLVFWCLENSRSPQQFVEEFGNWLTLVRKVRQAPNGGAALAAIWQYMLTVIDRFGSEDLFERLLRSVDEEGKKEMVSIADWLREEGERKGRSEGRRELLLRQLQKKFGELPQAAVARVNAADVAELDLWADRVLSAPTLAEVLDNP